MLSDIAAVVKFHQQSEAWRRGHEDYLPLFVDKEENGGEAGDENCHYDWNNDDQIKRNAVVSCQTEQSHLSD